MRGRNKTIRGFLTSLVVSILIVSVVSVTFPELNFIISNASASPSPSSEWFYSGWQYRKMQNITLQQIPENVRFFDISSAWTTISGDPTQRHAFQPVHNATIMEVNKAVDGSTWKYLAYDSNSFGSQIRLYYTNDTAGIWTPYSANPILPFRVQT